MKAKSRAGPWYRKKRTPSQGRKVQKGVSVHSKILRRRKVTSNNLKTNESRNLLNVEELEPQHKTKRKKPLSWQLESLVKWLIILKLTAALVNEVYKFFR